MSRSRTSKKSRAPGLPVWTTFEEVADWRDRFAGSDTLARLPAAAGRRIDEHLRSGRYFRNNRYAVLLIDMPMPVGHGAVHLLVMPVDNRPGGGWSDLQRIKNEVVGRDLEMYQVHPPEDETVDAEHTYHLWGYRSPEWRLPLGLDRPLYLCMHHDFTTSNGARTRGMMYLPSAS